MAKHNRFVEKFEKKVTETMKRKEDLELG